MCRVPADAAQQLRQLADEIESGACTSVVWAACVDEGYQMRNGSSLKDAMVLASLLHNFVLTQFYET